MKKQTFLIFTAYVWTKMLLGLTFHPYSSIRSVVRRPILFPVVFSPFVALIILFIVGRVGSLLLNVYGFKRDIIAVLLSTSLISILLWQLLLLYLLASFLTANWRSEKFISRINKQS